MIFRNLGLILWKNLFIIRKRHWILTLVEILLPILLFSLIAYGRSKITGLTKNQTKDSTYYDPISAYGLETHLPVGEFKLWYCPNTDFTDKIIKNVQEKFAIPGEDIRDFNSEEELLKHFAKNANTSIIAITFKGDDEKQLNYDISIHDKYLVWDTDKLFLPFLIEQELVDYSKYIYRGFAALQVAINTAFIELFSKEKTNFEFYIQQFPYPPHTEDAGISQLFIYFLPLLTMFSFIFLCPAVLKRVGEEKHSGTKEFLKMVGMKSSTIWLGWLIHGLSTNLFSIIVIVIIMKVPFGGVPYPPIEFSNGVILFLFLFLYCMAAITFCFLIATIFGKPNISTLIGILIWIFSYFIPQTLMATKDNIRWFHKIIFAIFPNVALQYGYSAIAVYEMREVGIQWNNICQSGSGGVDDITMSNVCICLIVDMIIFMALTLYIENVKPGKYGIAKPLSFPLINVKNAIFKIVKKCTPNQIESTLLDKTERGLSQCGVPCIEIKNLKKKFYKNVAVEDLTMDIYKNHITVLLGHNGAGKTTTMSILTGMINATSGSVKVNGKDIKKHTDEVRKDMGLCPQHNLLFTDLSVLEHLQFFGMLRGKSMKDATSLALVLLKKFGIPEEKKYDMANTLSGGMKRKLCLGMAIIGNPEVLILDEPTSGMDPESRREIWNLLLDYKKSKTILITTHFMEEADALGDWIAIMANGRLQCYDTPMHLKERYNTGYHLSLMLSPDASIDKISNEITFKIPEAYLLRQNGDNAVYLLPLSKKQVYAELFKTLEDKKEQLGIITLGLSITTLNDVFLKALDNVDGNTDSNNIEYKIDEITTEKQTTTYEAHLRSFKVSFWSLFRKRCYFLKRKPHWYIPAILVTILMFLLTMWLGMANTSYYSYGGAKLNVNLSIYGKTDVFYGGNEYSNSVIEKMMENYKEVVNKESGDPIYVSDTSQGIIQKGLENIAFYKKHMVVAAEFNSSESKRDIIVNAMYSGNAIHSIPISINLAMNAIVKSLLNDSFSIKVTNKPLKLLYTDFAPSELSAVTVGVLWLILIPTGMLFFMSNFITFPNLEVSTNFINIQIMAGVKTYIYWLINVIFDYVVICIPSLFVMFLIMWLVDMLAFESKSFGCGEIGALVAIFYTYTLTSLPFVYLFSYRKTISGGITLLIMLGLFLGITPTVVVRVLELSGDEHYANVGKNLKQAFLYVCPPFTLTYVCVKFAEKFVDNFNWKYMNPDKKKFMCAVDQNPCCFSDDALECYKHKSYFHNKDLGIEQELLGMLVFFVIYFVLLCFINSEYLKQVLNYISISYYRIVSCKKSESDEDMQGVDVVDGETQRLQDNLEEKRLDVKNLSKSFGTKKIVKDLALMLKKKQCFGLLGVNGAGKSTTFRMLIKDIVKEKGDIIMRSQGESISISDSKYSEQIGYCPQEDCLNYQLTGEELLYSIALLRGYPKDKAETVVKNLLTTFDLTKYKDKPCLEYSGGNKRKLCTCVAFIGSPKVIMLDEPTSGVDPASRRNFWNILSKYKKEVDTSILLCSHSMEECEALCDEIAIMKAGQIKAEGTLPQLKNKYENGYTIEIKLKGVQESESKKSNNEVMSVKRISDMLMENTILKEGVLKDTYSDLLIFQVKNPNLKLSHLFTELEKLKKDYGNFVDDYTLTQTSLEDIFLSVARED